MSPLGKICQVEFVLVAVLIKVTNDRVIAQLEQRQASLDLKCQSQLDANKKMSFPCGTFHTTVVFVLLQQLPVVTSSTIVRCRSCRTYINPFVSFLDQRRWKCNLCYRVNDGRKGGRNDEKNNSFHFHIDFIKTTCFQKGAR